jgi:hypothetical protein
VPGTACGVGEQRGEPPDPPVDGHVVDLDTTLLQKFTNIALRQAVAQIPADGDDDHLARERNRRTPNPVGTRYGGQTAAPRTQQIHLASGDAYVHMRILGSRLYSSPNSSHNPKITSRVRYRDPSCS